VNWFLQALCESLNRVLAGKIHDFMTHPFVTGKICNFADHLTRPVPVSAQEDNPVSRLKRDFQGDCLADRARCTGDQSQTMIMILISVSHRIPGVYVKLNFVVDEIPSTYKDIDEAMANQSGLVKIVHTLRQVVNNGG
jgi:hypothetical protein